MKKKALIGIGALILGLAAIAATSHFKAGEQCGVANAGVGQPASCCPIPIQAESQQAAANPDK